MKQKYLALAIAILAIAFAAGVSGRKRHDRSAPTVDVSEGSTPNSPAAAAPQRRYLGAYDGASGLFGTTAMPEKLLEPKPGLVSNAPQPQTPDSLAEYTFTGLVTLDGKQYALLENRKRGEGEYVAVGDEFQGHKIA